jgi:hypothetical protein
VTKNSPTLFCAKGPIMPLVRKHLQSGAHVNYIQLGHQHTAIDGVIAAIEKTYAADSPDADPLMGDSIKDWLIETVLQGAYPREYHLWEKDCKVYFSEMARRNGAEMKLESGNFTDTVKKALAAFGVAMPEGILDAIERMRKQVNKMKHAEGLELDHFVSKSDYEEAMQALEGFWHHLASCERVSG